jgi:hypothetical protein
LVRNGVGEGQPPLGRVEELAVEVVRVHDPVRAEGGGVVDGGDERLGAVLEEGLVGVLARGACEVGLAGGQHPGDLLARLQPRLVHVLDDHHLLVAAELREEAWRGP